MKKKSVSRKKWDKNVEVRGAEGSSEETELEKEGRRENKRGVKGREDKKRKGTEDE